MGLSPDEQISKSDGNNEKLKFVMFVYKVFLFAVFI